MSESYDFTVTGFGRYNFKPRNRFFVVNPATKRVTVVRAGGTHGASVEWSGQLVTRGKDIIIPTLAQVKFGDGCSEDQKNHLKHYTQMIVDRVVEAQQLVVCVFPE